MKPFCENNLARKDLLLYKPTPQDFEIIPSDSNHWAITLDGFSNPKDAIEFCNKIEDAIQNKKDYDNAVAEAESIEQSRAKESSFEEMIVQ